MNKRQTEMYCHGCDNTFTAELDMDLNGNHEIECPHCGHIHYRVVEDGKVTGDRYRSSMQTVVASASTGTTSYNYSTGNYISWQDTSSGSTAIKY